MSKTKPTTNILQLPREVFHHHIFSDQRLSINSVEQLKIVEQYGILDPKDIMPNLSIQFLNSMSDNQNLELLKLLIDQYGVYIGHYGCSLLYVLSDFMIDFVKTHIQGYDFTKNQNISGSYQLENSSLNKGFNDHSEETEKFGIPFPLQYISLKSSIQTIFNNLQVDPYLKDMYGNNILHYCYFFRIALLTTEKSALNLEEEAISKLLHEPNHFGVTPFMIDVLQHSFRHEEISFTLTYHPNYHCASLKNRMKECHGLKWTPSRILLKFTNATAQSQHYPNIDARDENGKHWCHYKTRLFSVRNDLRECVTCNDKDNVILLHTLTNSLLEIHRELLTNQILPSFDYLAYFDHFGWNRLMHIFAFITNFVSYPQFEVLKEDLFPIGFEYINKQQTQDQPNPKQLVLVSVQTFLKKHQNQEVLEFRLNRTEFPELKKRGELDEEFEEGDDLSHFIVKRLLRKKTESLMPIVGFMLNKGLHLQITRNKAGKTAFDVLKEHVTPLTSIFPEKLLKDLKRPLNSQAQHKFTISIHGNHSVEIIERGEDFVVCKKENTIYPKLELKKYFESKTRKVLAE
ncbi:hypothetical protein C9374_002568 [Naegleria lovaniensis]|uniref:Uncharacterized protein n=1 Tax=Naegleria lovaniensis TaxID=51637 RepID=A0AA88GNW4_NAELO|nr:uncharacterized protein C9374_002568 [Naegleria lovaniensis]KAG2386122.1 hypothetical protein C9374_002568 [Naegleria lovaniensis]